MKMQIATQQGDYMLQTDTMKYTPMKEIMGIDLDLMEGQQVGMVDGLITNIIMVSGRCLRL